MKHLTTLFAVPLLVLGTARPAPAGVAAAIRTRPNLLVIYTDDQGYGDMSALNPKSKFQTPNLDRLAREGMVFTDGHSADTVCTPSRYALLTGRYSWRTSLKSGVLHAEGDCLIAKDRMTVASLLKANGYKTAIIGKWHLQMKFPGSVGRRDWTQPITDGPTERGFDYYFGIPASMNYGVLTFIENTRVTDPPTLWTRKKTDKERNTFRFMPPYETERQGPGDIEIAPSFRDDICLRVCTEKALAYLARHAAEAKAGKPFFLYLPLNSPHLPHSVAPEFVGQSRVGAYGDFMLETDHRVGQVLAALDEHGLTRDTLVFLSSDNGAETGYAERLKQYQHASSGEFKGGKRDIYEGGHRVPFVMRWPAIIQAGRTCDEPVGQVDLLATCAAILDVPLPANAGEDSYSLLAAMRSDEYPRPLRGPLMHHSGSGYLAIREGPWKLNLFRGSGGSFKPAVLQPKPGEPPFELYDLAHDWGETTNACAQQPDVVNRLKATATKVVRDGRSTPGAVQKNDGPQLWPELTWIPEAAAAAKPRAKGNARQSAGTPVRSAEEPHTATSTPPAVRVPGFNWDRVPLNLHFGKRTTDLTEAEVDFVASHSNLIALEKGHGATPHGSTEAGIADSARRITQRNPAAKVLFYFNAFINWPGYDAFTTYRQEWTLRDAAGKVMTHPSGTPRPDPSIPEFREWWSEVVAKANRTAPLGGVFIDALPQALTPGLVKQVGAEKARAVVAGLREMIALTKRRLGPDRLVVANGLRTTDFREILDWEGIDGVMIEHFGGFKTNSPADIKADLDSIALAAAKGKFVVIKGWPGFNWLEKESIQRPYAELLKLARERLAFPLACFLVAAQPGSHFCYSWGYTDRHGMLDTYPEFDRPLGPPKAPAVWQGLTATREFAHASVWVDLTTMQARIDWH